MPSKKKKPSLFGETPSWVSNLWRQKKPGLSGSYPSNIYHNIETLPFDRFITAVVDQDLRVLIISGDCDPITLADAWLNIFLQYLDANGGNQAQYKIDLIRDIEVLKARVQIVDSCLYLLQLYPGIKEAEDHLVRLELLDGYIEAETVEEYYDELNMAKTRSGELSIDLKLKNLELEELLESEEKEAEDIPKVTRQYFLNVLARLATFKRVAIIRTSEITVAEFCAMFNEYLNHKPQKTA